MEKTPKERLHKVIAASGICSRREAEFLIAAGRVKVNGKGVQTMGVKVGPNDRIAVDNKLIPEKEAPITLMLHKPRGFLTSKSDPFHNKTVMDLLPPDYQHLNPVGRLDKDSEGMLLFTSDGAMLERLTHPKFDHVKIYEVLVKGDMPEFILAELNSKNLVLEGYKLRPMLVKILNVEGEDTWLEFRLKEGRKRQIRRVMERMRQPVLRLIRVGMGGVKLGKLPKGEFRILEEKEIAAL